MEESNIILEEIKELIEEKQWKILREKLNLLDPIQLVEIIESIDKSESIVCFRLLKRELAKETFEQLSYDDQEDIIQQLNKNKQKIVDLLNDLDPDDRTAFFEENL